MSHITHFYHLTALDYIDASGPAMVGTSGISVAMPPWTPQHQNLGGQVPPAFTVPIAGTNPLNSYNLVNALVGNYVNALEVRRECHVLAAEIDGKHPCQNAQVPGGITTKPSTVNWTNVVALMDKIRSFIATCYIPDLLTVALAFGGETPYLGNPGGLNNGIFAEGVGHRRALAYGAFPNPHNLQNVLDPASGLKLFSNGAVTCAGAHIAPVRAPFNPAFITERVVSSFYNSPDNLHPSVGQTAPYMDTTNPAKYTWHKAPRYQGNAYEVGPLARMLATALDGIGGGAVTTVNDGDIPSLSNYSHWVPAGFPALTGGSIECATNGGYADHLGVIPAIGPVGPYTAGALVLATTTALNTAFNAVPALGLNPGGGLGIAGAQGLSFLFSIAGRHAARALEAKYIADAMGYNATGPGGAHTNGIPYINAVILDPALGSDVYTYQVMPKSLMAGAGLTEAPRGALGHWITSEFRKIVNYQAVVPSTWNACGTDGSQKGPIEASLNGSMVGDPNVVGADATINNLLKLIHPFDICIACSVHVTDTTGNDVLKFNMDPDGRVTKIETATKA
jgi:Ni,Fe-hydrogenase I large subunit